jgi:RNA polymerase sigma factor (sigma-70 family)
METRALTTETDVLLLPFLRAEGEAERERLLARLVEEQAAPVVRGVFKSKLRVSLNPSDGREENQDALELFGDVCADLVAELRALRDEGARPVANFRAYVAGVAFNACYRHLRRKYPQRHSLKTRVRYLLTHHEAFALWEADGHEHLCGPAAWRGRAGAGPPAGELPQQVRSKLRGADAARLQLAEVLTHVFEAARSPLELDDLVNVVAELTGVSERKAREEETDEGRAYEQVADARAGVDEEFDQREYVARLWAEVRGLPVNQRAALLLNLRDAQGRDLLALLPYTGTAGVRQIAEALDIPAEEFARLWNDLPLEDKAIAERLGLTRQQVINLRKSARARLGRRLKDF